MAPPLGTRFEPAAYTNLPPELAKVALEELGETADVRCGALVALRAKMGRERANGKVFYRDDDAFLLRFLRARKFRVDDAFKVLCNYCQFVQEQGGDPTAITAADVRPLYDLGFMAILPGTDRLGRRMSTMLPAKMPAKFDKAAFGGKTLGEAMMQWNLYSMDRVLDDVYMQVNGYVIVESLENFSMMDSLAMNRNIDSKTMKKLMGLITDTLPVRLKGIYIVHQPWYISVIMAIVKPFISRKMSSRMKVFGTNLSALHELVDPAQLPAEYGGTLHESESWLDREEAIEKAKAQMNKGS